MKNLFSIFFFGFFLLCSLNAQPGSGSDRGRSDRSGSDRTDRSRPDRTEHSRSDKPDTNHFDGKRPDISRPDVNRTVNNQSMPEKNSGSISSNIIHDVAKPAINYRGTRKPAFGAELEITRVKKESSGDGLTILVNFNQEINPLSLDSESVRINGTIAKGVEYNFGKNGDSLMIMIPLADGDFTLSLNDIETYSGEKIEHIVVIGENDE